MTQHNDVDLTLPPVPFLADLREAVLERSTTRMPKWRFRFAPDLIAQIQPKPALMLPKADVEDGVRQCTIRFDCRVVVSEEASAAMLERTPKSDKQWWLRYFEVVDRAADVWEIQRKSGMCKRGADHGGFVTLETRFRDALAGGFFDDVTANAMLAPQCLVCGKALTDPSSMARFVGPECAGSSSLCVPRLFSARAA